MMVSIWFYSLFQVLVGNSLEERNIFAFVILLCFFMLPCFVNHTLNCDTWHNRRSFTVLKSRLTCRSLKEKNE